jgi:hypothetical protein
VFKLRTLSLQPGERQSLERKFTIRPVTTRRYYPGQHRLEIQVNGEVLGGEEFELEV